MRVSSYSLDSKDDHGATFDVYFWVRLQGYFEDVRLSLGYWAGVPLSWLEFSILLYTSNGSAPWVRSIDWQDGPTAALKPARKREVPGQRSNPHANARRPSRGLNLGLLVCNPETASRT
eukprot:4534297-Pleurochrysis_carterae.AAC.4